MSQFAIDSIGFDTPNLHHLSGSLDNPNLRHLSVIVFRRSDVDSWVTWKRSPGKCKYKDKSIRRAKEYTDVATLSIIVLLTLTHTLTICERFAHALCSLHFCSLLYRHASIPLLSSRVPCKRTLTKNALQSVLVRLEQPGDTQSTRGALARSQTWNEYSKAKDPSTSPLGHGIQVLLPQWSQCSRVHQTSTSLLDHGIQTLLLPRQQCSLKLMPLTNH